MKDYSIIIEKLMDGIITILEESYDCGYEQGYADAKSELGQNAIDLAHEESDRAYQQGLEDAWEAAKKIHGSQIPYGVFGLEKTDNGLTYASPLNLDENMSASEAISKIKEYEDKQKQDTIQVGDEVVIDDKGRKAVVSRVLDDAYNIVFYNGDTNCVDRCFVAKTGRHFDQIAEVLAEMRGESE